ncbi:MAG TPA: GAF domain-containing protein, partial [Lacipirellulaceae bacterium]|nr:GAF domain-containing protein [Lacipirellulaceae bacterium]
RRGLRSDEKISISKTILDYVVEKNEGVLTSNARDDSRWDPAQSIVSLGVREAICVPMQGRYELVGAIYIDTAVTPQKTLATRGANQFTEEHLRLMIAIAHQAALAIEDTSYYKALVQAERLAAIGQTIASLSHHIKNILQGVRGGSYLIELGLRDHDAATADDEPDAEAAQKADDTIRKGWAIV